MALLVAIQLPLAREPRKIVQWKMIAHLHYVSKKLR